MCSFVREKVSVLCFKGHLINMDIRICGCVDVLLLLISLCRPNFLGTIGKVYFTLIIGLASADFTLQLYALHCDHG